MLHQSDLSLVEKTLSYDTQAFAELVRKYEVHAYRFAISLLGNEQDAQDAVSESFFKAYKNLGSLRGNMNFKSWLFSIVHNCSYDILRKRAAKYKNEDFSQVSLDMKETKDDYKSTNQRMDITKILQYLSPEERSLIVLKYYYAYDYKHISELLKLKIGTLSSKIARAKKKLRDIAVKEGIYYEMFE